MNRRIFLFCLLIFFLISSIFLHTSLKKNWELEIAEELDQDTEQLQQQLQNYFAISFAELKALAALISLNPELTQVDFNQFSRSLLSSHPPILAIQIADADSLIKYIYPLEGNEVILQDPHSLLEDADRIKSVKKAVSTGSLVVQDPFLLRQGFLGTVARLPVFIEDNHIGFAFGVYNIEAMLTDLLSGPNSGKYNIQLEDSRGNIFYGSDSNPSSGAKYIVTVGDNFWHLSLSWKKEPTKPFFLGFFFYYIILLSIIFTILFLLNKFITYIESLKRSIITNRVRLEEKDADLRKEIAVVETMQTQLSASEEKYHKLIHTTIDGVITFNSDLVIRIWNPAAEALYGYSAAEMIGKSYLELVPPVYRAIEKKRWIKFRERGEYPHIGKTVELISLHRNGMEVPIESSFSCSRNDKEVLVTVIVRNISSRKEKEHFRIETEQNLKREVESLKEKLDMQCDIQRPMGSSETITRIISQIQLVAPTDLNVIIQGESGTGKEIAASMIHNKSRRRNNAFVAVDCGAIPLALFESELFGYEKGAFTGADGLKIGKFEEAKGGTLFLDEITNLTCEAQAKLLRIIQERRFYRVGGDHALSLDVRVIAATNKSLNKAIKSGEFRDDLYHRLNQFSIEMPPLTSRKDDIPQLVHAFIQEANREFGKNIKSILPQSMKMLLRHNWPGNVRELKNVIKRAVLMEASSELSPTTLEYTFLDRDEENKKMEIQKSIDAVLSGKLTLPEAVQEFSEDLEREVLEAVLAQENNNQSSAARILSINRKTLYMKMKKYNMERIG